jgi:uncharacterized membrane protein YkvA (DUF1232 family)
MIDDTGRPATNSHRAWWQAASPARLATLLLALWKLFRHPDTPWLAKGVAIAVVAYALSPIDLIPDFIPLLGQLDDFVVLPLGIALAVMLTPGPLWQVCLREAEASAGQVPRVVGGAVIVVAVWLLVLSLAGWGWYAYRGEGG